MYHPARVTNSNVRKKFVRGCLDLPANLATGSFRTPLRSVPALHSLFTSKVEQFGRWNSGPGSGMGCTTKKRRCRIMATSAYGIDVRRGEGRGGCSSEMMFQYNFGKSVVASDRAFEDLRGARLPIC